MKRLEKDRRQQVMQDVFSQNRHDVFEKPKREDRLVAAGRFFDLQEIFDDLNQDYFDGRIDARITWGRRSRTPKNRSRIRLGVYVIAKKLIRINRSLDRRLIPRHVVERVVYHEMLHQVHGVKLSRSGRGRHHTPEFRRDESMYRHFAAAMKWQRENISYIISY